MVSSAHICALIIFTTVVTFCTAAARTRSRANYGEFCDNRSIRCESGLSLSCKDQKCECMKPESMIYDPARSSCTALAGEKCKYTVLEEYRSWQEEILCVSNAHCDFTKSICVCNKNYIDLLNGTCVPKKNYNEPCETTVDCKQDSSLICKDSKCTCNPIISEYSDSSQSCVGLADKPCVNDLCTANAICREETRRYYASSSPEDSDEDYQEERVSRDPGSIGRCQCRTAFGVTSDGRCAMGYGGKCDHQQATCMSYLKCVEGQCVCKYPNHQIYDKISEACSSKIFGPCTGNATNTTLSSTLISKLECIAGAVCSKKPDSSKYQCLCAEGYIENGERSCSLDFGQKCSTQMTSSKQQVSSMLKCDKIGGLSCINGRCKCIDDLHAYDQTSRKCKGLAGASCNVKTKDDCISGSFCKEIRGGELGGICQCQEFYAENEDGTCTPKPQQPSTISVKSGGRNFEMDDVWNASSNTLWTIFDKSDEKTL